MTLYTDWLKENSPSDGMRWLRIEATEMFSFAILDDATVAALLPYGPFLEVGAGTGYWAHELRLAGADIVATDPDPYSNLCVFARKRYPPVEALDALNAVHEHPGRTLLVVWPSHHERWAVDALMAYAGDCVVYVGEGHHGCCANDAFFEVLAAGWIQEAEILIPQWEGSHDYITVYRRRL